MLDLVSLESKAVEKGCIEQTGSPRTKFTKFYKLHIIHHYSSLFIIILGFPMSICRIFGEDGKETSQKESTA
jgi:hypothetical protein